MNEMMNKNLKLVSNQNNPKSNIEIVEELMDRIFSLEKKMNVLDQGFTFKRVVEPDDYDFKKTKQNISDQLEQPLRKVKGSNHILTSSNPIIFKINNEEDKLKLESLKKIFNPYNHESPYNEGLFKDGNTHDYVFENKLTFPDNHGGLLNVLDKSFVPDNVNFLRLNYNSEYQSNIKKLDIDYDVTKFGIKYEPRGYSSYEIGKLTSKIVKVGLTEDLNYLKLNLYPAVKLPNKLEKGWDRLFYEVLRMLLDPEVFKKNDFDNPDYMSRDEYEKEKDHFYKTVMDIDKCTFLENYQKLDNEIKVTNDLIDEFIKQVSIDFPTLIHFFPELKKHIEDEVKEIKKENLRKSKLIKKKVNVKLTFNSEIELETLNDQDTIDKITNLINEQLGSNLRFDGLGHFYTRKDDFIEFQNGTRLTELEIL